MKWLRGLAMGVGALAVLVGAVAFGARFADGPVAILPGGPFKSGEWVEQPLVDFGFAEDIQEIELESGDPKRSRTTWILVLDHEAYVPCSLGFPPGKSWHEEALIDPSAVVRIDGKRYRRELRKVEDPLLEKRLGKAVLEKYEPPPSNAGAWFFHLAPPAA